MKGYVRLKDPDEEIFLGEGAGCAPMAGTDTFRVWDNEQTLFFASARLETVRLGTGRRPEGYAPV